MTRQSNNAMVDLLSGLVEAAGGTEIGTEDTGGWFDLGLVTHQDNKNKSKPCPGAPGHFTCEG